MLSFDFSETKYVLKVNYVLKCCGESGPRALIRTWLRFTFKAFPSLFFLTLQPQQFNWYADVPLYCWQRPLSLF